MMNKKILVFSFAFILVIAGLVFVFAVSTPTLVTPVDNANISGTYTFNSTVAGDNANNVTFYWWNSTGSSWKLLCYNSTGGAGPFTCFYDTTNLPDGTGYTFNATAENATATFDSDSNTGITVDNTAPIITIDLPSAGWKKENINIYANATDATTNITNSTMSFWFGNSTGNFSVTLLTNCPYVSSTTGFNCSATFNTNNLADDNYTLWVNASDTMSTPNVKDQSRTLIGVDNAAPSVSLSASSATKTSLTISISGAEGTCTVDRSGASISGSTLTESGLSCGHSYAYVVTCTDSAGNAGSSSSTSFSTSACSSGGTSPTYEWSLQKSHSWSKITPGAVTIMKNFDKEIGLKQIQIEVNNEAQSVKITISKYNSKPAEVSIEKSGEIYRYLQINAENLEGKLEKAVIRMQVEKSWMVANGFGTDNMAMFKFDENSNKWDELDTTYVEADNDYYYYDAEVDSFSYFAISERAIVDEDDSVGEDGEEEIEKKGLGWWWIVIIAGVIIIVYWVLENKKKISKLFKKR